MSDDVPKTRLIRIPPFYYLHVLDRNTNVTRMEVGPQTFVCREHERLVFGPEKMIIVPPRHYCIILNPVVREQVNDGKAEEKEIANIEDKRKQKAKADEKQTERSSDDLLQIIKEHETKKGKVIFDAFGQAKLRHADKEIRFEQNDPFPLFPGEQLIGNMNPLSVVKPNTALKLRANRDFVDRYSSFIHGGPVISRKAGDEWLYEGPATYFPQIEVDVIDTLNAVIVKPNQALKLCAKRACIDRNGKQRKAGEEWLERVEGAYLPQINEQIVQSVDAIVLTEKKALHLKARKTFKDVFGVTRKAGEEWLVTLKDKEIHIPDVYEKVVAEIPLISLTNREWCIIINPVNEKGEPQLGSKKLVRGEANFFLQPGESMDPIGIKPVYVLGEEEALFVYCKQSFDDKLGSKTRRRTAGERWLIYGPTEYVPPLEVDVLEKRKAVLQVEQLNLNMFYWKAIKV